MGLLTRPFNTWMAGASGPELAFLWTLTAGHLVVHWYTNLLSLALPLIKQDLELTDVQVGTIITVQMGVNGSFFIISGFLSDSFRHRGALIVSSAILSFGIAFFIIGISPSYVWTLVGAGMVGLGTALWHPGAMGAISLQFPNFRGIALSIHGVGASLGDAVGPLIIGAVILTTSWKSVLELHLIPATIIALILWRGLPMMRRDTLEMPTLKSYVDSIRDMFIDRQVLTIISSDALMKIGRFGMLAFFPIYIIEDLGYSEFGLGVYLALLYIGGVISQPVMGTLSDYWGRKVILVPSFALMGLLYAAIVIVPKGIPLGLVIGVLGMFFYPVMNWSQTAIMDVSAKRIQSSTVGIRALIGYPIYIGSPIFAGYMVTNSGIESVFWYAAITALLAAAVLVPVSFRRTI